MKERKRYTRSLTLLLVLVSLLGLASCRKKPRNLNVLVITVDGLRAEGTYSSPNLPSLRRLGERGVSFSRAYTPSPSSLSAYASLVSGLSPLAHGVRDDRGFVLSERVLTLAESLKTEGYATGGFIGSYALDSRFGTAQGFDHFDERYPSKNGYIPLIPSRPAGETTDALLSWIEKNQGKKWMALLNLSEPGSPEAEGDRAKYGAALVETDKQIGRVLDVLQRKGLLEKTVIVLTAPFGSPLGDHGETRPGFFAYDSTLRVPLVMVVPGFAPRRVEANVSLMDVFPSLCAVLNMKSPGEAQGRSLLPLLKGKAMGDEPLYFEALRPYMTANAAPLRGYILGGKKFIDLPSPEGYNLYRDGEERANVLGGSGEEERKSLRRLVERLSIAETASLGASDSYHQQKGSALEGERRGARIGHQELLPLDTLLHRSQLFLLHRNFPQAIGTLSLLLQKRPEHVEAILLLASSYREVGQLPSTERTLLKGLRSFPDHPVLLSFLGSTLVESGRYPEAVAILQKTLTKAPKDEDALNYLGLAYWRRGLFKEALNTFYKAVSVDSGDAIVYSNIGSLYLSAYLYDKALENFRKAVEKDPRLAAAYNGLGSTFLKLNRFGEAEEAFRHSISVDPSYYFSYFNLLVLYAEKLNDKPKALALYETIKKRFYPRMPVGEQRVIEEIRKGMTNG